MPLSGGAAGSVRPITLRTSAPLRSHPGAEEIHFLRPLMTQFSPEAGPEEVEIVDYHRG